MLPVAVWQQSKDGEREKRLKNYFYYMTLHAILHHNSTHKTQYPRELK